MSRKLRTVAQLAADPNNPFTESQARWWIFNADANGMTEGGVIVRVGRRIYIDTDAFDRWLVSQNPTLKSTATAQAGAA